MKAEHQKLVNEISLLDERFESIKRDISIQPYLVKRTHVLIYEDNEADAAIILDVLRRFEIERFVRLKNANNWVADVTEYWPKVILLDIIMPGKTGYEFLREISQHPIYSLIPVIVLSSRNELVEATLAKKWGAVAIIPKPIRNAVHLYNVLSDAIRNSQLHTLDLQL